MPLEGASGAGLKVMGYNKVPKWALPVRVGSLRRASSPPNAACGSTDRNPLRRPIGLRLFGDLAVEVETAEPWIMSRSAHFVGGIGGPAELGLGVRRSSNAVFTQ